MPEGKKKKPTKAPDKSGKKGRRKFKIFRHECVPGCRHDGLSHW